MVNDRSRANDSDADDMQNMGVRRLQGQTQKPLYTEGGGRLLSLGAVRLRNLHIQRKPQHKGCSECGEGLAGVLAEVEEDAAPEVQVAESTGANASGDPPPTPSDGDDPADNPYRLFP